MNQRDLWGVGFPNNWDRRILLWESPIASFQRDGHPDSQFNRALFAIAIYTLFSVGYVEESPNIGRKKKASS